MAFICREAETGGQPVFSFGNYLLILSGQLIIF
jgi:hypothetical protein